MHVQILQSTVIGLALMHHYVVHTILLCYNDYFTPKLVSCGITHRNRIDFTASVSSESETRAHKHVEGMDPHCH